MGLIDLGITRDDAIAAGAQVPPGKYDGEYVGLLRNDERGDYIHIAKDTGSKMVKASFRVVNHPDPLVNGKRLPVYQGVAGSFSLSDLMLAVPDFWPAGCEPGGPDGSSGVGTIAEITVTFGKKEYADRTQISKLRVKK